MEKVKLLLVVLLSKIVSCMCVCVCSFDRHCLFLKAENNIHLYGFVADKEAVERRLSVLQKQGVVYANSTET